MKPDIPPGMMLVQQGSHERMADQCEHLLAENRRLTEEVEQLKQGRGSLLARVKAATKAVENAVAAQVQAEEQLAKAQNTRDKHTRISKRFRDACEDAIALVEQAIRMGERRAAVDFRALRSARGTLGYALDPDSPEYNRPRERPKRRGR